MRRVSQSDCLSNERGSSPLRGASHGIHEPMTLPIGLREEAVRLRVEERRSNKEICAKLKVSAGTMSLWLKEHPLAPEEKQSRWKEKMEGGARRPRGPQKIKDIASPSKHYEVVKDCALTNAHKMAISESAVLFRLALHGYAASTPVFEGVKIDWLVKVPTTGRIIQIQVKTVRKGSISLRCANGRGKLRRYMEGEFDVIVGYDLFRDTAYVYLAQEVMHLGYVATASQEAAERWDKLLSA